MQVDKYSHFSTMALCFHAGAKCEHVDCHVLFLRMLIIINVRYRAFPESSRDKILDNW